MIINVIPINDEVTHVENESCWCKPTLEENGQLIVHNSFDGREDFEEIKEDTIS